MRIPGIDDIINMMKGFETLQPDLIARLDAINTNLETLIEIQKGK